MTYTETATVHFEAGVSYYRIRWPHLETKPDITTFAMDYVMTTTNKKHQKRVYIVSDRLRQATADLARLCDHWTAKGFNGRYQYRPAH